MFKFCRYIPANFENMFSKYARSVPDKLTFWELWHMTEANRNALDFFGWFVYFPTLSIVKFIRIIPYERVFPTWSQDVEVLSSNFLILIVQKKKKKLYF